MATTPGPPGDPTITAVAVTTEDMAVTWITPTADGNPTSYNISITNRSDPVKVNHTGPSEYTHIFRGLRSDTMYTVLLVAINCAGVSNTTEIFQRTTVTGTIEKMFHTTYYLYPTSPVISNKGKEALIMAADNLKYVLIPLCQIVCDDCVVF
ncbi:hypothetical protein EMCRGX_G027853 [Ephydatia muelleri]